jgi:hypothetical protein
MILFSKKVCIAKGDLKTILQIIFHKVLFSYFQKIYSQTLVLFCYASKVLFAKFIKFYWKSAFVLKIYFLMVLNFVLNFRKFLKVV